MAQKRYPCQQVVAIEDEPRHHLVIENEFVRAFAVEIAPHDCTLCHRHPNDYLLYVAGDAEIISAARDEEPKTLRYRDGECELSPAGLVHVVENLADTAFRNVVVELMPAVGALRRGARPVALRGEASIEQLLDDDRAAIFSIEIEPGAEVEIAGPAVVATPYGNAVEVVAGESAIKLKHFNDLAWLASNSRAVLLHPQEVQARVVISLIGRDQD